MFDWLRKRKPIPKPPEPPPDAITLFCRRIQCRQAGGCGMTASVFRENAVAIRIRSSYADVHEFVRLLSERYGHKSARELTSMETVVTNGSRSVDILRFTTDLRRADIDVIDN